MDEALQVIALLKAKGLTLATAESLTDGMLGQLLTGVSGSSAVYRGGVISYCNAVKHRLLGVEREALDTLGAVSEPVARQMAQGARAALQADIALSTTGIAGPNSDETGKPVGLVYVGLATAQTTRVLELRLQGDRDTIRRESCRQALQLLLETL